jgi:hypothetical protein
MTYRAFVETAPEIRMSAMEVPGAGPFAQELPEETKPDRVDLADGAPRQGRPDGAPAAGPQQ